MADSPDHTPDIPTAVPEDITTDGILDSVGDGFNNFSEWVLEGGIAEDAGITDAQLRNRGINPDSEIGSFMEKSANEVLGTDKFTQKSPKDALKAAEFREEIMFQSQCFLIENYDFIVPINMFNRYENILCVHGNPSTLVTNLTAKKNINGLLNVTTNQISRTVPQIRIYKTLFNDQGEETDTIEFKFDDHLTKSTMDDLTSSRISRGSGVGMMNFEWKFQGTTPAESHKIIEGSMKLRFSSLEELEKERHGKNVKGKSVKYRFIDLILPPKRKMGDQTWNPNYFVIKALVGWSSDFASEGDKGLKKLKSDLRRVKTLLKLVMTTHEIDFRQDGTSILTINFNASYDTAAEHPDSDVFSLFSTKIRTIENELEVAGKVKKRLETDCPGEPSEEDTTTTTKGKEQQALDALQSYIDQQQGSLRREKTLIYKQLIDAILKGGKMYAAVAPWDSVNISSKKKEQQAVVKGRKQTSDARSNRAKPRVAPRIDAWDRSRITSSVTASTETIVEEQSKDLTKQLGKQMSKRIATNTREFTIPFFFLGDLMDVALSALHSDKNEFSKDLKTLVGDVLIYDPRTNEKVSINLADVPISWDLFFKWFIDVIFSKQKNRYNVKEFIVDVIEKLVSTALRNDSCFTGIPQSRQKLSFTYMSVPKKGGKDRLDPFNRGRVIVEEVADLPNVTSANQKAYNYMLIYMSDANPTSLNVNSKRDREGVPMFSLGRDRGLVKRMIFTKQNQSGLREANLAREGDSTFARLAEPYIVNVEMIGNTLHYPGQLIYVNPSTLLRTFDAAQALNIKGFFRIHHVENFIEAGRFETIVQAWWQTRGDGKHDINSTKVRQEQEDDALAFYKNMGGCAVTVEKKPTPMRSPKFTFRLLAPDYNAAADFQGPLPEYYPGLWGPTK